MEALLSTILLCMILCSIAVAILPNHLIFIATHGKNAKGRDGTHNGKTMNGFLAVVSTWTVPKSLFTYMYIFGIIVSSYHIVSLLSPLSINIYVSGHGDIRWMNCISSLLLLEFHLIRRLWECYYCTIYGDSVMHVSGLFCGLLHYFLVPLCIKHGNMSNSNPISASQTWKLLSIALFFVSNYFQYQHHLILYKMKLKFADSYALPKGALFRYVCCPHYLMEILIYFSFLMQSPKSLSLVFLEIWVACNLCVVAHQNLMFYRKKFKDAEQLKRWKRVIPLVW